MYLDATCFLNPSPACTRGIDLYVDSVAEGFHPQNYFSIWTDGTITIKDQDSKGAMSVEADGKVTFSTDKSLWLYFDISNNNKKPASKFGSGKKHMLLTGGIYSSMRSSFRYAYKTSEYKYGYDATAGEVKRFPDCHPTGAKLG